jgi:putative protease
MEEKLVGKITHYYGKINVAIVELSAPLKIGDKIHLKGHETDFEQIVSSMQIEHQNVDKAKKGDAIGLKVDQKIREGDEVYLVKE